ncbi:hypothetical protein [Flavobacterium sp. '19STA2R22 D10 B1']|uniref:hypothetical protein n=1 Tax=Flavobacterium aerium TaxID=3037261 RepID=UPI00278C6BFD|nr:hypothetical protein [Flavobacterium sp. '19STA2R22 D10 B1']
MNQQNFNQTGGFPLETEVLDNIQESYSIFNSLGAIAGNYSIISGCYITGSSVSNGFVYIDGELLSFQGGFLSPDVIIISESSTEEFEDGSIKEVHFKRYATFGTAEVFYPWSSFIRPLPTNLIPNDLNTRLALIEKKLAVFTTGHGMVLFQKPLNQIPTGWAEVVDWRGRMPMGLDTEQIEFDAVGKNGGNKKQTLNFKIPVKPYPFSGSTSEGFAGNLIVSTGLKEVGETLESLSKAIDSPNITQDINFLNPYRIVVFIEFIG